MLRPASPLSSQLFKVDTLIMKDNYSMNNKTDSYTSCCHTDIFFASGMV